MSDKVLFKGEFNWYGAPALAHEPIMYNHAGSVEHATAMFMSRIATHLGVKIGKVINYYVDHPLGYKVEEV
jgi:hypothetical protein